MVPREEREEDVPVRENNELTDLEGFQSEDAQPLAEEVPQTVADSDPQLPSVEDSVMELSRTI